MINIYRQDNQQQFWQLLYNLNLLEVNNFYKLHHSDPTFKDFSNKPGNEISGLLGEEGTHTGTLVLTLIQMQHSLLTSTVGIRYGLVREVLDLKF